MSLMYYSYKVLRFTAWFLIIATLLTLLTGFFTTKSFLAPWLGYDNSYYYHTVIIPTIFIPLFFLHSLAGLLVLSYRFQSLNNHIVRSSITLAWTAIFILLAFFYFVQRPISVTEQQLLNQTFVQNLSGAFILTPEEVAKHSIPGNCWLIIQGKIYDVTSYLNIHPGGASLITPYCGRNATSAFSTKGEKNLSHSPEAVKILNSLYVGFVGEAIPQPQMRNGSESILLSAVSALFPGSKVLTHTVRFQYKGVLYEATADVIGNSVTNPRITAVKPGTTTSPGTAGSNTGPAGGGGGGGGGGGTVSLTLSEVLRHNNLNDCWLIINNKVYDVTRYINNHPGGSGVVTPYCGKDATRAFNTKDKSPAVSHTQEAVSILAGLYIGDLGSQVVPPPPPPPPPVPPDTTPPSVPTGLNTTALSGIQISLTWQAASDPETGIARYNIYRNNTLVGTSTSTSYTDSGLIPRTSYSYQVSAVNGREMESQKSNASSARTLDQAPPPPPSINLTVIEVAKHNAYTDCWLIINGKVYNVTRYLTPNDMHPDNGKGPGQGQNDIIAQYCGKNSTIAFATKGNTADPKPHSQDAINELNTYYLGELATSIEPPRNDTNDTMNMTYRVSFCDFEKVALGEYPDGKIIRLKVVNGRIDNGRIIGNYEVQINTSNGTGYKIVMNASGFILSRSLQTIVGSPPKTICWVESIVLAKYPGAQFWEIRWKIDLVPIAYEVKILAQNGVQYKMRVLPDGTITNEEQGTFFP